MTIENSLANHSTNKVEEVEVIRVDIGLFVGVIGAAIVAEVEQCVVRPEHCLGEVDEEVARQATGIDAHLVGEFDAELASQLVSTLAVQLIVGILEDLISLDGQ